MKFTELLKVLERHYGTERLADIAKELDVTPQVVNNWKIRNHVPYKYIKLIREKKIPIDIADSDSFDLDQLLNDLIKSIFRYYRIIIFAVFITASSTALYVVYVSTPVFISNAKVLPVKNSENKISSLANQFGLNIGSGTSGTVFFDGVVYPEVIKSRDLLESVLKRKFYTNRYKEEKSLLEIMSGGKLPKDSTALGQKKSLAIKRLKKTIEVKGIKKTPVVGLKVMSFEPKLVASIAGAIIDELDKAHRNFKYKQSNESLSFINQRIKEVEHELAKIEEKLKDFRQNNRQVIQSPSLLLQQERLIRDVEVQTQLFITLKSKLELLQIESLESTSMLKIIETPNVPLKRLSPQRVKSVILSSIISFLLSVALAYYYHVGFFNKIKKKLLSLKLDQGS